MPRKTQFTAGEIVDAAYDLVREKGWEGLSVKAVAQRIGSSTMPVYSYFENLEKLKDAVVEKGWQALMVYETKSYTGDVWMDHSMGCIRFAMDETRIFYTMFDGRNMDLQRRMSVANWRFLTGFLKDYEGFKGLEAEQIFLIRYSRTLFTQGLATSATSNWGRLLLIDGMIENLVIAVSQAMLKGYKENFDYENEHIAFIEDKIKKMFEEFKESFEEEAGLKHN